MIILMVEEAKGRVYRDSSGRSRKAGASHTFNLDELDWVHEEACKRGVKDSVIVREAVREKAVRTGSVPPILPDATIEHHVSFDVRENKLILSLSSVDPTDSGPVFAVPHGGEGPLDADVKRGPHQFDLECEGCELLAASGMLPRPMRRE